MSRPNRAFDARFRVGFFRSLQATGSIGVFLSAGPFCDSQLADKMWLFGTPNPNHLDSSPTQGNSMRFLPSMLVAICVVFAISSLSPASAQLIRINNNGFGGVNIRAPFVRVNTSPYGTHVRAPFVEVNSPPGRYYQPPYYAPAQPYYRPAPGQPYYRPVPGQPYYQAPVAPGAVMRQPSPSPRFNPTRPGQQVQSSGVAPGVTHRNAAPRVTNRQPGNQPAQKSVNRSQLRTVGKPPSNAAQATPNDAQKKPLSKTELKSVLDKPSTPSLDSFEELPVPKQGASGQTTKKK